MTTATLEPSTIFERFRAIHRAMHEHGESWETVTWMRFASLSTLFHPGEAAAVAEQLRARADDLRAQAAWYDALASPVRYVLASISLATGSSASAVFEAIQRGRTLLAEQGIRYGRDHEVLALGLHHLMSPHAPLDRVSASRIKALYKQMKRYHWWLTGPDDLPACVMLSFREGSPESIVATAEQLYLRLHQDHFRSGNRLQSAVNLLQLCGLTVDMAASRFEKLHEAFSGLGNDLSAEDYDTISMLCLLDHDPSLVSTMVGTSCTKLQQLDPPIEGGVMFALAADLTFLELSRWHELGSTGSTSTAETDRITSLMKTYRGVSSIVALRATHSTIPTDVMIHPSYWP